MKTLRLTFTLLAVVMTTPVFADADPEPPKAEKTTKKKKKKKKSRGWLPRGFSLEAMKELGADKAQLEALRGHTKAMKTERKALLKELRDGGTLDKGSRKALKKKLRQGFLTKMKAVLSKDQYKVWREGIKAKKAKKGGGGKKERDTGRDVDLRNRALSLLAVSKEEGAVLGPLVDGVLQTRRLLREEAKKRRTAYLEKVAELEDPKAVAALLATLRKQREEDRASLKKSRQALRETLTPIQEARLVGLGVLD